MIAAIILNYQTWETTISCIKSIKKTSNNIKVYVVDNDSPNDSYNILSNEYKNDANVNVFNSGGNLGYARGNNFGALKAIEDGYDILLFTNNDIIFENNAINKMINTLNSNFEISTVSPLIKSLDGHNESLPILSSISTIDYLFLFTRLRKIVNIFIKENIIRGKYELRVNSDMHLSKIYRFSGCCFMIRVSDFKEIGMFDEGTFMYFEEDILCHKLFEKGYQSFHRSDAIIQHHHGKTTGSNNFFVDSEMLKSEIYYFTKYCNINIFLLIILYLDRILTPLIRILLKKYSISFVEYSNLIQTTFKPISKYIFNKTILMKEWNE